MSPIVLAGSGAVPDPVGGSQLPGFALNIVVVQRSRVLIVNLIVLGRGR